MRSCIYEGTVTHDRRLPIAHRFAYRLFMVYLDLEELPALVGRGRLISDCRRASHSFIRDDHLFRPSIPLADEIREFVREHTGIRPAGRIGLLTQLRYFGFYFSPLNLFYIYDRGDHQVEYIIAEVNNTPWNERHCYLLSTANCTNGAGERLDFRHAKQFHVSPFMDMDSEYRWCLTTPSKSLEVQLAAMHASKEIFAARMELERFALNSGQLRRARIRYPMMTGKIVAAIYLQAFKLWWKKCPFYPHPNSKP